MNSNYINVGNFTEYIDLKFKLIYNQNLNPNS